MADDQKKKTSKKKKDRGRPYVVFLATAFVLSWLGLLFVLFPVSNPLRTVGGTSGEGIVYAVLMGIIVTLAALLFFVVRSTVKDIMYSVGDELGIDVEEVIRQYKKIIRDEYLVLTGKKDKVSDHHDDERHDDDEDKDPPDDGTLSSLKL